MMTAGNYYVGDLCYVMSLQWDEFCNKTISKGDFIEGEITFQNGIKVLYFGTCHGDGSYQDQFGNHYGVDAGLIGCIRLEDINDPKANVNLGNVIQFETDFEGSYDDGLINIGHLRIDTKGRDNEEEEY